jgi:hypothetical protein
MAKLDMDVEELVAADLAVQKLQAKNRELSNRLSYTLKELALSQDRASFLQGIQAIPSARKFSKLAKTPSRSSAVILGLMDLHLEERVDPSTIGGLNTYTPKIAAARVRQVFEKAVYLLEFIRGVAKVDQVVLAVLGDLITGYIHEELVENNYLSPTEACLLAQDLIHSGIQHLLKQGGVKSILVCCCHGNHGRLGPKKMVSTGHVNSLEWMLYHQMERAYRNDPRVAWKIEDGILNNVPLVGQDIRFTHGDYIKFGGGVGGIAVPVNKKLAQWNKIKRADFTLFGHFHSHMEHWDWMCGGCVIGYNAYAMSIGAEYQPPSQPLVLIDRKHGKCLGMPVFAEV